MEVSGRRVRSGLSRDCDLAARGNDRLENDLKGVKKKKKNQHTSEGVELVILHRLLISHFLTLLIRLKSVQPPFVGIVGVVVAEAEAIVSGAEGIAETEG